MSEQTDLVVHDGAEVVREVAPALPQTNPFEVAKWLAASGYFDDAREATQALVKILAGRELGLGDMAAMTGIHVIKGKVTLGANLLATLVDRSLRFSYKVEEQTDTNCVLTFYEHDAGGNKRELGTSPFSAADAKRAGTQNMNKFPRNMLFARAMSNGVKWYCPGVTGGGPVYTPDELGVEVDEDGQPVQEAKPAKAPQEPKQTQEPPPEKASQAQIDRYCELMDWAAANAIITEERRDTCKEWGKDVASTTGIGPEINKWKKVRENFEKKMEEEMAEETPYTPPTHDGEAAEAAEAEAETGVDPDQPPVGGEDPELDLETKRATRVQKMRITQLRRGKELSDEVWQETLEEQYGVAAMDALTYDMAKTILKDLGANDE